MQSDVYLSPESKSYQVGLSYRLGSWCLQGSDVQGVAVVNRVPVHKCNLTDGDVIQLGENHLEFCAGDGIRAEFFANNEEKLHEDVLTKALNRGAILQYLEQDLRRYSLWEEERRANQSRGQHPPMSLIMLDIDHFKQFNDKYDHLVGDEVLKGVVARIKKRVRATDIVGKYGGEEFLVYLPNTDLAQALEMAEELRTMVADTAFEVGAQKGLAVTISLGVVQFQPSMNVQAFVRAADTKLLEAKRSGRNRVMG